MKNFELGWVELHWSVGETKWRVNRDCVFLNDKRILNGVEVGCPSDEGRRYLVADVRTAIALRDKFDQMFPEIAYKPKE